MGLGADVPLVQGVQHGVPGAVRRGAGALHLLAAEVLALAAERTLIDLAVVRRENGTPKCSSSITRRDAARHMYSIASWSPSQSLPLTVSYICQCQLSGCTLASAAFMPPWAATV